MNSSIRRVIYHVTLVLTSFMLLRCVLIENDPLLNVQGIETERTFIIFASLVKRKYPSLLLCSGIYLLRRTSSNNIFNNSSIHSKTKVRRILSNDWLEIFWVMYNRNIWWRTNSDCSPPIKHSKEDQSSRATNHHSWYAGEGHTPYVRRTGARKEGRKQLVVTAGA